MLKFQSGYKFETIKSGYKSDFDNRFQPIPVTTQNINKNILFKKCTSGNLSKVEGIYHNLINKWYSHCELITYKNN